MKITKVSKSTGVINEAIIILINLLTFVILINFRELIHLVVSPNDEKLLPKNAVAYY